MDNANNLTTNANVVLDCFINSIVQEGLVDENLANIMRKYQIIVVNKTSFADRFKSFFGYKKDESEESQLKFVCVKVCGYDPEEDEDSDLNEDDDDFLKRIGVK